MVSLKTGLTLGLVALGAALFFGLGGAQGIGARLGSGFKGLGESFITGLGGGILPQSPAETAANPTQPAANLTGQAPPLGLPQLQDNLEQTQNSLQGINNFFSNLFSGSLFNPQAFSLPSSFTPAAIQNRISFEGAGIPRTQFGGFLNATEQEIGLQQAITASQKANPSFFKL